MSTLGPLTPGPAITFSWDPSPDPSVSGYRLYGGTASRDYAFALDAGNETTITVSGLDLDVVYFFAATSYDTNGTESDFSAEVVYTNRAWVLISGLKRNDDGNFSISGLASPAQNCVLLAATNLTAPVTWTPLATNVANELGAFSFMDLEATNYSRRFYQVVQPGAFAAPLQSSPRKNERARP